MVLRENKNSPPLTPLDASTVILLREAPSANPFEVLLMSRHAMQNFAGKAFVYPGGQLDEEDCNPKLADYASGLSAKEAKRRLNEPDISDEKALGLFFAAVRETFEESGVLLKSYRMEKVPELNCPTILSTPLTNTKSHIVRRRLLELYLWTVGFRPSNMGNRYVSFFQPHRLSHLPLDISRLTLADFCLY
jgi:8-oxo-dGTP pyrophosphatase MutT (NUDIX family)